VAGARCRAHPPTQTAEPPYQARQWPLCVQHGHQAVRSRGKGSRATGHKGVEALGSCLASLHTPQSPRCENRGGERRQQDTGEVRCVKGVNDPLKPAGTTGDLLRQQLWYGRHSQAAHKHKRGRGFLGTARAPGPQPQPRCGVRRRITDAHLSKTCTSLLWPCAWSGSAWFMLVHALAHTCTHIPTHTHMKAPR